MKIVFMGTPEFAVVSFLKLLQSRHDVIAAVTIPDKGQGRGRKIKPSAVKKAAIDNSVPVLQPENLKDKEFIEKLKQLQADIFVVVAFRILPAEVFTIPPRGTINVHASLLPQYRGAAPINWAIINGDEITGVTTMLIDEKVDTGNILLQESARIKPEMNAGILHDILAKKGASMLLETIDSIELNSISPLMQDNTKATKAPKITREICRINFNDSNLKVFNLIRGLSPFPAAFTFLKGRQLKIFTSRIPRDESGRFEAGTVTEVGKNSFTVSCSNGVLEILEVQLEGKKRMNVSDFLKGFSLEPETLLG